MMSELLVIDLSDNKLKHIMRNESDKKHPRRVKSLGKRPGDVDVDTTAPSLSFPLRRKGGDSISGSIEDDSPAIKRLTFDGEAEIEAEEESPTAEEDNAVADREGGSPSNAGGERQAESSRSKPMPIPQPLTRSSSMDSQPEDMIKPHQTSSSADAMLLSLEKAEAAEQASSNRRKKHRRARSSGWAEKEDRITSPRGGASKQANWEAIHTSGERRRKLLLRAERQELIKWRGVTRLFLNNNKLKYVPDFVYRTLRSLKTLVLRNNSIKALPADITRLVCLETLDVSHNLLEELPPEVGQLPALQVLHVAHNRLRYSETLDSVMSGMTRVYDLHLGANMLQKLPDSIENMTALVSLNLYHNLLTELPEGIGRLPMFADTKMAAKSMNTKQLILSYNRFEHFPRILLSLSALQELHLSGNALPSLPKKISQLQALTWVSLANNRVQLRLPETLPALSNLQRLYLRGSSLASLPSTLPLLVRQLLEIDVSPDVTLPKIKKQELKALEKTVKAAQNDDEELTLDLSSGEDATTEDPLPSGEEEGGSGGDTEEEGSASSWSGEHRSSSDSENGESSTSEPSSEVEKTDTKFGIRKKSNGNIVVPLVAPPSPRRHNVSFNNPSPSQHRATAHQQLTPLPSSQRSSPSPSPSLQRPNHPNSQPSSSSAPASSPLRSRQVTPTTAHQQTSFGTPPLPQHSSVPPPPPPPEIKSPPGMGSTKTKTKISKGGAKMKSFVTGKKESAAMTKEKKKEEKEKKKEEKEKKKEEEKERKKEEKERKKEDKEKSHKKKKKGHGQMLRDSKSNDKDKEKGKDKPPQPIVLEQEFIPAVPEEEYSFPAFLGQHEEGYLSSRFQYGCAKMIGMARKNEDVLVVRGCFRGRDDEDYFAVFDGHGGKHASAFCSAQFHRVLAEQMDLHPEPEMALRRTFAEVNARMLAHFQKHDMKVECGTTAVVALVVGNTLYVANVGDSRAVFFNGYDVVRLSTDHRPEDDEEARRIRGVGGQVRADQIVSRQYRICQTFASGGYGGLAVSRAMGDFSWRPYISDEPTITITELPIRGNKHQEKEKRKRLKKQIKRMRYTALHHGNESECATPTVAMRTKDAQPYLQALEADSEPQEVTTDTSTSPIGSPSTSPAYFSNSSRFPSPVLRSRRTSRPTHHALRSLTASSSDVTDTGAISSDAVSTVEVPPMYLVMGCDGVWDVLSDKEAIGVALSEPDALSAAVRVRDTAFYERSGDDIACLVVRFV
ncbi:Protein phosphatase 1K, mitochondrial, variant 2 [Balamuthia mandrillaris]